MSRTEGIEDRLAEPYPVLRDRAVAEARIVTGAHCSLFGLDRADWSVDQAEGTIRFSAPGFPAATAPVQIVGTRNRVEGTWLWGWDHPSVRPDLRKAAGLCRDYGRRHGLEAYTTAGLEAGEAEAWEWTAVARRLSGAEGVYRAPTGDVDVFVVYGTVTVSPRSRE